MFWCYSREKGQRSFLLVCKPIGASAIVGLLLGSALHIHSLSNYEEKGVGLKICKNIKMTLYSEIKPIG